MKFKITMKKGEDGWYTVTCPSLPGCISQGKTEEEAKKNMKEAIELHIESLAEEGLPIIRNKNVKETVLQVNL
jgi:predicted RNase H-like HicB family nuclease